MKLFLSYPRKDKVLADKLLDILREGGHEVWKDTEQLRVGQEWRQGLHDGIVQADGIVLALTPNWIASPYCQWEFVTAVESSKKIIPVMLIATELPECISKYQYQDLTSGLDDRAKKTRFLDDLWYLAQSFAPETIANLSKSDYEEAIQHEKTTTQANNVTGSLVAGKVEVSTTITDSPITIGDNAGSINIGGVQQVFNQISNNKWSIVLIGIVLIITIVLLFLSVLSDIQRDNFLHRLGAVAASVTPSATLTVTPTPTITPTATPIPTLRKNDIGIAIANFAIPDDGSVDLADADTLVAQMEYQIALDIEDFALRTDLRIEVLSPTDTGRVTGDNAEERLISAIEIGERHEADIVVYGVIKSTEGILNIQPEFYVAPDIFSDAQEITGGYYLGDPINVEGPLVQLKDVRQVNRPLSARTTVLVQIFGGLFYYGIEEYTSALVTFERARTIPDWNETEGGEVLAVLIGNTYARLASEGLQNDDFDKTTQYLDNASTSFNQAIDIDPNYLRPYTGLAAITYLRWNMDFQQTNTSDSALLYQALDYLDQAQSISDAQGDNLISSGALTKVTFNRLQVNFALWVNHADNYDDDGINSLYTKMLDDANSIIERHSNAGNKSIQELASETYNILGLIELIRGDCETAINHFANAIDLSFFLTRRMFFFGLQGDCYIQLGQSENAAVAYDRALSIAQSLPSVTEETQRFYEDKLQGIQGRG